MHVADEERQLPFALTGKNLTGSIRPLSRLDWVFAYW
jgi:hypothetical protein